MAVTLSQAKLNVTDDLQLGIIDEFAKSSFILNNIPFHDCVSPVGGGATLTYGYTRLVTQPLAEFRMVNGEYQTHEVEKQRYTTDLKVFGGAYEVDRIIAEEQCFSLKDLAVNGSDLVAVGIEKGPQIGVLLNQLLDEVISGNLPNEREVLLQAISPASPS